MEYSEKVTLLLFCYSINAFNSRLFRRMKIPEIDICESLIKITFYASPIYKPQTIEQNRQQSTMQ